MWPFTRRAITPPHFPPDRIGFAIGDIHGRADLLARALTHIEAIAPTSEPPPIVVFLGDYIDRGPASAEVLDLLIGWSFAAEKRFLLGNHEQSMLAFLDDPVSLRAWLNHGGRETLLSFGIQPPGHDTPTDTLPAVAASLKHALGQSRQAFLNALERYVEYGDYLFVHAGIDPLKPLDQQEDLDLLWIRERFLHANRKQGPVVVHGHTPAEHPMLGPRRIGIDTGAYATGCLTIARFEQAAVTFTPITIA
ncbi:MAG: metallophosphoesterase family protein [Caulobacterales bacterium]